MPPHEDVASDSMEFGDKLVIITGACGAVGRTISRSLVDRGATVFGVDRNSYELLSMVQDGLLSGSVTVDLRDENAGDVVASSCPNPQILINNAGIGISHVLRRTTLQDVSNSLSTNFEAAFKLTKQFLPTMVDRRWGRIINISSVLALHPVPTTSVYSASKAAVTAFTRGVAIECAGTGVTANVIAPGYMQSPKNAAYFESVQGQDFVNRFVPGGTLQPVDSLVGPVLFLASGLSSFVTGHVLVVDGGYSLW